MGFMDKFSNKRNETKEDVLDENNNMFVNKKEYEDRVSEGEALGENKEEISNVPDEGNLDQSSVDEEHNKLEEVIRKTPIGKYLDDPEVTDISFNGTDGEIRLQDNTGLHTVYDPEVTGDEIENLGVRVAGEVKKTFDGTNTILDTAVGRFRMNFMHSKISPFGATMSIRVSKPKLAIQDMSKLAPPSIVQVLNLSMKINENVIISGQTGSGKSCLNEETIPTPEGDKTMGDIKVGDYVYDRLGKPTKVLGVYPQGKLDVYEVKLVDGRTVRCSEDHIWAVFKSTGSFKNKTVREMLDEGISIKGRNDRCKKHYIPMNGAVEKKEKEFKVHPYVMGALLGDGSLTRKPLIISSEDDWIPKKVARLIGSPEVIDIEGNYDWGFRLPVNYNNRKEGVDVRVKNFQTRMILPENMIKTCHHRSIPKEYFEGSIEQRFELMRGLMDTDGSISRTDGGRFNVTFKTVSKRLSEDVSMLSRSLGYKTTVQEYNHTENPVYNVRILAPNSEKYKMFSLPRKLDIANKCKEILQKVRYDRVAIDRITKLGYQDEMTCILVDNEEHLFQVGEYVVTHNTELVRHVSI